jgi:hypothetical protein
MIGKTVSGQPTTDDEAISGLAEGEIGVFSVGGLRRDTSDTDANFILVVGGANSKPAFVSDVIKASDVDAISTKAGNVAIEQIDSIGYNGASGSIATLTADNLYMVDVMVQELLTSNTDGRYMKHFQYKSGSSAPTQADVASGLAASAYKNFSRDTEDWAYVNVLMPTTSDAALGTGVDTMVFNKGSVSVSCTDVDDATTNAAIAVGDYLRVPDGSRYAVTLTGTSGTSNVTIGGVAYLATFDTNLTTTAANFVTSHAAALLARGYTVTAASGVLTVVENNCVQQTAPTSANVSGDQDGTIAISEDAYAPVYKVTAIDATNNVLTLNRPYAGESITQLDPAINRIPSASAATLAAGVKICARALSFVVGKEFNKQVRWELVLKDFGTTVAVRDQGTVKGLGTYREVAELEWFLAGHKGEYSRMGEPAIHSFAGTADSTKLYDATTIVFKDSSTVGFQNVISPKQLTLMTPDDNAATDYMDDGTRGVWDVLAQLTSLTVTAV